MKRFGLLTIVLFLCTIMFAQENEIVTGNNGFTIDLFKEVNKTEQGNLFLSPFSVYDAMAMVYDGAAKKTAKEMKNTLKFAKNQETFHKNFAELLKYYDKNAKIFKTSNTAVTQEKYVFLDSYIQALKDYDAQLSTADFTNTASREKAVKEINSYVAKKTNDKVKDILSNDDLSELTRLVLINTIYFNANWATKFKGDKTRQMTFYGKDGEYITDFMNGTQRIRRAKNENAQMIEIPYEDNQASMIILLPNEGTDIEEFVKNLSIDEINNLNNTAEETKIDIALPKFRIESKIRLKQMLINLGIKSAFSKNANFSKMNGKSNLLIDNVIHQTFVDVAENGTEAAAATAVIIREKTALPPSEKLLINRPFVFLIRENNSNAILFIGKYLKPETTKTSK